MPDSKHTLEIVTKTKDLASKDLKRMGVEGQKAGKKISVGLGKADDAARKSKRSFIEAGAAGGKAAGIAGAGFSAAAAGIAAANANAENFETSMISVGASVATAFATGGPIGAGIALVSVGIGALISDMNAAEKEAEELAKKWEDVGKRSVESLESIAAANRSLTNDLRALRAELSGEDFDRERVETIQRINNLEEQRIQKLEQADAAFMDGQEDVAASLEAEAEAINEQQNTLRRILATREDIKIKAEEEAETAERLKKDQEEILKIEEARKKEAEELEEIARKEEQLWDDIASAMERLTPEYEKQSEELGQHLDLYKRLISEGYEYEAEDLKKAIAAQKERKKLAADQKKAEQDVLREMKKQRDEAERFNRTKEQTIDAVRKEIELLDARNEEERQAILDERERQDLLAKGVTAEDIETLQSARRAKAAREAADAAGDEADNLERAAKASGKVQERGTRRGRRRAPKSFNQQRATFGVQFSFGSRRGPKKKELDEQGRPVLPEGFTYTTQDEQDAWQRNRKAREQREFEEYERKKGRDPATGEPLAPAGAEAGSAEETQRAADGAGKIAEEQKKTAEAATSLADNVEKAIPPTEQIATGMDKATQGFTTLATAIDTNTSSVDKFATQVEGTSTSSAQAIDRTSKKLDRLITQLVAAQVIAGGV